MKKYLSIILLIAFIVPSIASASWWNPFSWKIFKRNRIPEQVEVVQEKTPEEKISELQQQLDELKNEKTATSKETVLTAKKEVIKSTSTIVDNSKTLKLKEQAKEDEELKAKFAEQDAREAIRKAEEKAKFEAKEAQDALGKNYYNDTKTRINTLIGIENAYKTWLQDTSNQFRSASLVLAGYNTGGLYGDLRDSSIKLANAEISALSSMIAKSNKDIIALEEVKSLIYNDPQMFVTEATFKKFLTPENLSADINGAKSHTNEILENVLRSLQYH